jgi:hypothetical protein
MRHRDPRASSTDIAVTTDGDALTEARTWVARQLRFEHLLRSLEQQAGLEGGDVRPPRS